MGRLFAISICLTGPYNMMLPLLPVLARDVGGSRAAAGVVTGAMSLGTVMFELAGPKLVRRWSTPAILVLSFCVSGAAAAGLGTAQGLGLAALLGWTFGAGFGCGATIVATLPATLGSPSDGQRTAYSVYGFASSLPAVLGAPAALLLAPHLGVGGVLLVCGTIATGGAAAVTLNAGARSVSQQREGELGPLTARWEIEIAGYMTLTLAYGPIVGFVAFYLRGDGLASAAGFLLLLGGTRAITRTAAAVLRSARGLMRATRGGLAGGAAALVFLAIGGKWCTPVAGVMYGAAYGVLQTTTLRTVAQARPGASGAARWGFATDAGIGLGALVFAPIGAHFGYQVVYATLPVILLLGLGIHMRFLRIPPAEDMSGNLVADPPR